MPKDKIREALEQFIETIEYVGGITRDHKGYPRPVGDPSWIDLGEAYLNACDALEREPVELSDDDDEETNSQDDDI